MTTEGAEALRAELQKRKGEDRRRIVAAIAEARAHGDLKENAEYHAAREQQGFNEGRIAEIESRLSAAEVIDPGQLSGDAVMFGATVSVCNLDDDSSASYKIVGEDEADAARGKLSYGAPLARALMGRVRGDIIEVQTPDGTVEYELGEISYK